MASSKIDLFSWNLQPKKIKKKVRLIELFAGIGAQAKSLEMLGVDFEHYKIVEWAVPSIIAYNSIHKKDTTDYSENKTLQEMLDRIKGVSTNYNEPIAFEKLKSKPIERIRNVYNNCIATHNLINIMDVKGKDLEITEKEKYEYIMTYSFPCQDLSLAGKRAGMSVSQSEGGTRSGLLWEVERILNELERERALPQILLCENVPEIMSEKSMKDLQKWVSALEKLGYKSYDTILNAKNYGLPQNRRRFFMISILGEYSYEFPSPINLKWKLKDFLEQEVDENYFLSKSTIERISKWKAQQDPLKDINREKEISPTLTARGAGEEHSGMVLINENLFRNDEIVDFTSSEQFFKENFSETCPTLITKSKFGVVSKEAIPICEATKKGYKMGQEGDGVDISGRMQYHRGTVQKGLSQTILTKGDNVGVIVKDNLKEKLCNELIDKNLVQEGDIVKHSYTSQIMNGKKKAVEKSDEMITLTTRGDCVGVVVNDEVKLLGGIGEMKSNSGTQYYEQNRIYDSETVATSIPASPSFHPNYYTNLRIRKLTPKECMRLMGFQDKDTEAMYEVGLSNSAIYHCAGDSICVNVLIAIFAPLFDKDWRNICQLKNF